MIVKITKKKRTTEQEAIMMCMPVCHTDNEVMVFHSTTQQMVEMIPKPPGISIVFE
jgi:hypothetical protein